MKFIVYVLLFLINTLLVGSLQISPGCKRNIHQLKLGTDFTTSLQTKPPLKVLLLVEPTPFNYICGYANRFKEMLHHLKDSGDDVQILTPDSDPTCPKEFEGYNITSPVGFPLPMYPQVRLTFDLKLNILKLIRAFKPDLVHVSSPSCILLPAILWSRLFQIPLVMSYHTDIVNYAKSYLSAIPNIAEAVAQFLIRYLHNFADLTLCTSPQLRDELVALGVRRVDVWQKGINTEIFSPKYRSEDMRSRLSNGHPEAPLLLYVGRLGYEKKIHRLKTVLESIPGSHLVIVGKGPAEEDLKELFRDMSVCFTGELVDEELSSVFASCDIFTMPSDTETLGFVVLEALASGLPAVCMKAGGVVDIIQHNQTGFLCENNENMKEFIYYIEKLIKKKGLKEEISQKGLNWVKEWSWKKATLKLRNIQYNKALRLFHTRNWLGYHNKVTENIIMNE